MTLRPGEWPPIPQPRPFEPEQPEYRPAPPSLTQIVALAPKDGLEIAIITKRTFDWQPGALPTLADEQPPLLDTMLSYDGADPGMASPQFLPEIIGFKTGTDVVVQGSACAPRPVRDMMAGIRVETHVHAVRVFGRRLVERGGSGLRFGEPEPFETMALRYENAYGGRDPAFEQEFAAAFKQAVDPAAWRRTSTHAEYAFSAIHPFMYPRNRFGKGYVLGENPGMAIGRELPNIELPSDLLTPERLLCQFTQWGKQPIPGGFDYLDPFSFPRTALMGVSLEAPPTADSVREVSLGLIPGMPKRSIVTATAETLGDVVHPTASRCASLGLWMPFLRGGERVALYGMDVAEPVMTCLLPEERPHFTLGAGVEPEPLTPPELHLLRIDADRRQLTQIWVQRFRHPRPTSATFLAAASDTVAVEFRRA